MSACLPLPRAARRASTAWGKTAGAQPEGRAPASWGNQKNKSSRSLRESLRRGRDSNLANGVEPEHGAGVLLHADRVVGVGGADTAFPGGSRRRTATPQERYAERTALMTLYLPENAPPLARSRLRASRAAQALAAAGTAFLVYDPELADDDVLLLHFFVEPPDGSPRVAGVCTSGLCSRAQTHTREWCFETFELAVAFVSPGFSTAFLQHLLLLTRDVREWLADAAQPAFGFGDWIAHFPMIGEAKSALLIPPVPELVHAGLRPFDALPSHLASHDWLAPQALRAAGSFGFMQAVSVYPAEYDHIAASKDGFRFFLDHLLASNEELERGLSAASKILDMSRTPAL